MTKIEQMTEENQFMESSVEIPDLDNVITENLDSSNNKLDNSVEEIKAAEEKTPKKKSKIKKIIFIILGILGVLFLIRLAFLFLFIRGISNLAEKMGSTNIDVNQEDGLYEFNGYGRVNGVASYMLLPIEGSIDKIVIGDDESVKVSWENPFNNMITISSSDYEWIDGLYDFKPYIYLDLNFSGGKIVNWSIIDGKTKNDLGHLSIEELNQMYNFEAKYPTKEISYNGEINLSDLDENVIYKYVITPEHTTSTQITNDLNYDVVVYEKKIYGGSMSNHDEYEPKIYFSKQSDYGGFRYSDSNETVYMLYQRASMEDILYVLEPLALGQYEHGEEIDIRNEDYLYNDTNEVLKLIFIDESFGEKEEKEKKALKPGEVYKKGSFIDYVIIK